MKKRILSGVIATAIGLGTVLGLAAPASAGMRTFTYSHAIYTSDGGSIYVYTSGDQTAYWSDYHGSVYYQYSNEPV